MKLKVLVTQSYLPLCDPMDCSPPGFSVCEILQARILEWVAIPFSRASSWPRDWTWVSYTAGRFFTIWATREGDGFFTVWDTKWEVALWLFFSFSKYFFMVKRLPAMQETWVWPLGWEDALEKGMATHSTSLAWRIPVTEEPSRLQSMESQRVR